MEAEGSVDQERLLFTHRLHRAEQPEGPGLPAPAPPRVGPASVHRAGVRTHPRYFSGLFPQPPDGMGWGQSSGVHREVWTSSPWLRPFPHLQKRLRKMVTDTCLAHLVGWLQAHRDLLNPPSKAVMPWAAEEVEVWMLVSVTQGEVLAPGFKP